MKYAYKKLIVVGINRKLVPHFVEKQKCYLQLIIIAKFIGFVYVRKFTMRNNTFLSFPINFFFFS